jgi:hypothetical protein
MPFVPTMSVIELESTADEIIKNGVISETELPPEILVDLLIEQAPARFIAELGRSMIAGNWVRKVRAARHAKVEKRARPRPKGFEHLPLRLPIWGGKTILWYKANATQLDQFCSIRSGQHSGRKTDDLALKEGRKLRDRVKRRRRRGITAGEVLGFDW